MKPRHLVFSIAVGLLGALACGPGGTVDRYALCGASDTCPSATACETPASDTSGTSGLVTMCTWSCGDNDDINNSCPSDANGVAGACVSLDSDADHGFCFQTCSADSPCLTGETCVSATTFAFEEATMVCVPGAS